MPFEAHVSRWRSALLASGAVGFVAIGLWIVGLIGSSPPEQGFIYVVGWFSIVFFGACAVAWGRKIFRVGVEVRVDANGILSRRWSGQTIPWLVITKIDLMSVNNQRLLCLSLVDPAAFPSVTVMGRLARVNKSLGFGDVAISMTGTDKSFDELVAAVRLFAPGRLMVI